MIEIPLPLILVFGLIACGRELHAIVRGRNYKNLGQLFAFAYLCVVYALLIFHDQTGISFHGSLPVRLGIMVIFVDKAGVFAYEIWERRRHGRR